MEGGGVNTMTIKGKNSVMVGIRISESNYKVLEGLASKKGMTVSGFIKGKVEGLVNTINIVSHSVNNKSSNGKPVNTTAQAGYSVNKAHKPVNTMKDVLIDKEGHHYKLIGGVRCRIKE